MHTSTGLVRPRRSATSINLRPIKWKGEILPVWELIQVLLKNYRRWARFQAGELAGLAREQTCLEHVLSITILARIIMEKIHILHVFKDMDLLLSAFEVHDLGEAVLAQKLGEEEGDVPYPMKKSADNVAEFWAYSRVFGRKMVPSQFWLKAFLLQFCLNDVKGFPEGARRIMSYLAKEHRWAALLFTMTEHLDYIAYGYREFTERRFPLTLVSIFAEDHFQILDGVAREVVGVSELVWTPAYKAELEEIRREINLKKLEFAGAVLHCRKEGTVAEKLMLADSVLLGNNHDPNLNHKQRLFCDMFQKPKR